MPSLGFVAEEIARRANMWTKLQSYSVVDATAIRTLDIYRGQAGIFADKLQTRGPLSPQGVAVSFRHTGSSYADDLSDDGVIYHYPQTQRAGSHDEGEIESARTAFRLGVPVFVILGGKSAGEREVRVGYVEEYDDVAKIFLVTFTGDILPVEFDETADPFSPTGDLAEPTLNRVRSRPNQKRFAADVLKRYGPRCAVCDLGISGLIAAAHIRPKKDHGSDDPRNGLPLCANHHLALDAGMWRLDPAGNKILSSPKTTLAMLQISRKNLDHLPKLPHADAVTWLWGKGFGPI
jgi:putative restriction endonuclease